MENIFEKHAIRDYFFDANFNLNLIKSNLYYYLFNNLYNENYDLFRFDLKIALAINVNGKYKF
jgi:hypothetical protein